MLDKMFMQVSDHDSLKELLKTHGKYISKNLIQFRYEFTKDENVAKDIKQFVETNPYLLGNIVLKNRQTDLKLRQVEVKRTLALMPKYEKGLIARYIELNRSNPK
jgi:hypothetical protein